MVSELKISIKNILSLSVPILIENLLQTLLGVTDTYFAGQINDLSIVGIGVTNLIMNVLIAFFTAITVGSVAVIARNYGKKDYIGVSRSITHSLFMGVVLGISAGIVCIIFRIPILHMSGADSSIIPYAMPYYLVVTVPCVFLCLELILSSCLRAIKDTKTPMYITASTNIIKILITLVFFKLDFGVFGLGLATTISRLIGTVLLFIMLKNHDQNIKVTFCSLRKNEFSPILKIGIPAGIEKLIMKIGQLVYNSMVIHIGATAYVAHNIAGNIDNLSYTTAFGFGLAVCTIVGISIGENDKDKAIKQTTIATIMAVIVMFISGAAIFIFAPQIACAFTKTPEVQNLIVPILRITAFGQPFSAVLQIMTNALQGTGDSKFPMYSTFFGIWGIRDGLGFILAMHFNLGLKGVWYAYTLDLIVRGAILLIRFKSGKWQKISFICEPQKQ